jgi:hypothetical protein
MRTFIRTGSAAIAAVILLASASADASITRIAGPTDFWAESRLLVKFDVAFDTTNQVYLAVWGTQATGPTNGQFLSTNGTAIGSPFAISSGTQQAGWARVIYSAEQGKFLVAFTRILSASQHQRVARFVTYQSPTTRTLSPEIIIETWNGGAGTDTGMAYSRGRFVVTWWNYDEPAPQTYVSILAADGTILASKQKVTRSGDGETDSEIACDPGRGRCLVIGQSWGVFTGGVPATWAQFITDDTAAPVGGPFFVDSGPIEKEPSITFSAAADRFIVAFSIGQDTVKAATVDAGTMVPNPSYVVRQPSDDPSAGGFGRPRVVYNPATQTSVIAIKPWVARTGVIELDKNGAPVAGTWQMTDAIGSWQTGTQEVAPAADSVNNRFLVADQQNFTFMRAGIWSAVPACTLTLSPASASVAGGGGSGTIAVSGSCAWTATSSASWLAVTGTGSGTVSYSVAPNSGPARSASILIGGQSFTVSQAGCSFALGTPAVSLPAGGGRNLQFTIIAGAGCSWTAEPSVGWIATSSSGTGSGTVLFTAVRNPSPQLRGGQISVGGLYFLVFEAGATVNDLNDDGRPDLLFQNAASGELTTWSMNVNQQLSSAALPQEVDLNWRVAGEGDMDRDGQTDVIWHNTATGANRVWLMNGSLLAGEAALPGLTAAYLSWRVAGVGDFDADGIPDLVWQDDTTGTVAVWFISRAGDGSFTLKTTRTVTTIATNWKIRGVADFNRDLIPDLVYQDTTAGWIAVWFMGPGAASVRDTRYFTLNGTPQRIDPNWRIVAAGDFNNDLRADIVWQHTNGWLALWLTWDNFVLDTPARRSGSRG